MIYCKVELLRLKWKFTNRKADCLIWQSAFFVEYFEYWEFCGIL